MYNLNSISTKTKTMVLVLAIFLLQSAVFIYFRYTDIKKLEFAKQNMISTQIKNIISKTLEDTNYFYTNRGYANLNSDSILAVLSAKDGNLIKTLSSKRYEILKKENKFLSDMVFYDEAGAIICDFNSTITNTNFQKHSEILYTFFNHNENEYYSVSIPAVYNGINVGYVEFILNAGFILDKLSFMSDIKAYFAKNADLKSDKNTIVHIFALQHNKDRNIVVLQDIKQNNLIITEGLYKTIFVVCMAFLVVFLILNYGFNVLIKKLEELNLSLEKRVGQEIKIRMQKEEENLQKERMLIHQNKLASMGEMIGNIAHQWKQPLGEISAIFLKIQVLRYKKRLTDEILEQEISKTENIIEFMAKTIDDFRNFFAKEVEKKRFSVNFYCKETLKLMAAAISKEKITIDIKEDVEVFVAGYPREFSQAILNILNNAKDVFIERNIKNRTITIEIFRQDKHAKILIYDNAGGVKVEPIDKIFEPYFSTKTQKNGVGIGLYMAKTIIENKAKGALSVSNFQDGALFEITL